jgi:hypothetical protein
VQGQSNDQAIVDIVIERFQAGAACNDFTAEEKKTVQTSSSAEMHLTAMFIHQSDHR